MDVELDRLCALAAARDYFALLGVSRSYSVDTTLLKQKYLALSRQTHPDFFATQPEKLPAVLAVSAAVNEAYRTLEDPMRRAEYLLQLHGGAAVSTDKAVSPGFLAEVMELREQISEAKAAEGGRGGGALSALRGRIDGPRSALLAKVGSLASSLPADTTSGADPAVLSALRQELNALRYLQNLYSLL